MNNKLLKSTLIGTILSVSCLLNVANATLIQADYLAANDNLAAYDVTQNLDWLDLSVSAGWSASSWSTLVEQNAGWRLASNSEVENMLVSIFTSSVLTTNTQSVGEGASTTRTNITNFTSLFGRTITNTRSYGLYVDEDNIWRMAGTDDFSGHRTIWGAEFSTNYNALAASGNGGFGMYIVRTASVVPEPSSLAIFALGLMGLASRRFKKQS